MLVWQQDMVALQQAMLSNSEDGVALLLQVTLLAPSCTERLQWGCVRLQ